MSPEQLAKWAEQAELVRDEYSDYAGNMPQLEAFARKVAEDCAKIVADPECMSNCMLIIETIRAKYWIKP